MDEANDRPLDRQIDECASARLVSASRLEEDQGSEDRPTLNN